MNRNSYIFTQLCQFLPRDYFEYLVKRFQGNRHIKSFSCWNHLLVLLWAQLADRESLRDIVDSLRFHTSKFYHLGFGKSVCRTTLAEAGKKRDIRIFELFAKKVVEMTQQKSINVDNFFLEDINYRLFAADSTTIPLNHLQFGWTKLQNGKGGIKMHTLLDILSSIPVYNIITDNDVRDQSMMDLFPYAADSFYVFDKAYVKLVSLLRIDELGGFYIVRRKRRMSYEILEEYDCPNKEDGVIRDLKIVLSNRWAKERYQKPLRIVCYYSREKNCLLEFFTNNFELEANKIAYIYKSRWQIELFFKWIKQHLKIKQFYGVSENAVKIQIYVAIIAYCIIALVRHEYKVKESPLELMRMLSVSLFEKINLRNLLEGINNKENLQIETFQNLKLF